MASVDAPHQSAPAVLPAQQADNPHSKVHRLVPNREVKGFGFDELWSYRELIFGLFYRDIMTIANQTPIAWFWRFLSPTFTLITYTILFEQIGKVDFNMGVPYFFVLSAALIPWTIVQSVIIGVVSSVAGNQSVYNKIYFPRIIPPLVSVTNAIVDFILTSILLLGLLFYMGMPISFDLIFVPFFAVWALMLGLGFGLWLGALNMLYRDISQSLGYVLQIAFFFSPIVYPSDAIPEEWRDIYHLNPVVGIIEGFRWAFLGKGDPPDPNDVLAFGLTFLFLMSGVWFFRRLERVFADI